MSPTLLAPLLPERAETAEAFEDPPEVFLFPEERAHVARAVDKRRREFATVRHCARRALAALGSPRVPLLPGLRGAPGWPDGVVGSMTHCTGYRGAAVARGADIPSFGIDAEPHGPLPEGVLEAVARPAEQQQIAALVALDPSVHWDRLLFSAKEAVYKTWYPLTGEWLDFEEAELDLVPHTRIFRARLLKAGRDREGRTLSAFEGRWQVTRGLVLTAAVYRP